MKRRVPHPLVARAVEAGRRALARTLSALVPPELWMLELILSGWLSQAVCVAAKLGIAELLENGPASAQELSAALGCDATALARLMRALAQHGIFRTRADGRFEQTRLSRSLLRDDARSVRAFALYVGSREHREHWSMLEDCVRCGAPRVETLRGMSFFAYLQSEPAFGSLFHEAMTGLSALAEEAVLSRYDFSPFPHIIDVGGGEGHTLASILQRAPLARGTVFDQPEIEPRARERLSALGVDGRATFAGGSFFDAVPSSGDLYVLKHVLHDFADAEALRILRNVRAAMSHHATLLLLESVVPPGDKPQIGKLTDLEMLLCLGGRERSLHELTELLEGAGFELRRNIRTAAPTHLIEARVQSGR